MLNRPISRGRVFQLGGALAAAGALAAQGHTDAIASMLSGEVTVNFWTPGGSARYCQNFSNIARDFHKLHPNITIGKTTCGTGQQDFLTVLLARIAAGNPPDATIYWDSPVTLGARGAVMQLDPLMAVSQYSQAKNWPASALASCQFRGKTWGLPLTGSSYGIWFNQDLFAKKGIPTKRDSFPKTWDELRKLSKEFTHWKGDTLVSAGFMPMNPPELPATIFVWSALNGGVIYNADHQKYTIDSDQNVAMMQYMLDWLNEEYKGNRTAVDASANWAGYADAKGRAAAFQSGKLAMLEQGFWFVGDVLSAGVTFKNYEVAQYPFGPGGKKTVSGFWPNWAVIPQGSQHPQEGFKWLDYLAGVGVEKWFAVTPDLPTNRNVPASLVPAVAIQQRGQAYANDLTRFFHHQLDISVPMWNSPVQGFAFDQISKAVNNIMHKVAKPKDALAAAQRASQNELQRVLRSA